MAEAQGSGDDFDNSQSALASRFEDVANEISKADLEYDNQPKRSSHGNYSDVIGTGKHAKTNIIWYMVSGVLVIFSCICVSLVILVIYRYNISEITQSIKDIWSVFTPIITLSLGYLFGKKSSATKKD